MEVVETSIYADDSASVPLCCNDTLRSSDPVRKWKRWAKQDFYCYLTHGGLWLERSRRRCTSILWRHPTNMWIYGVFQEWCVVIAIFVSQGSNNYNHGSGDDLQLRSIRRQRFQDLRERFKGLKFPGKKGFGIIYCEKTFVYMCTLHMQAYNSTLVKNKVPYIKSVMIIFATRIIKKFPATRWTF